MWTVFLRLRLCLTISVVIQFDMKKHVEPLVLNMARKFRQTDFQKSFRNSEVNELASEGFGFDISFRAEC